MRFSELKSLKNLKWIIKSNNAIWLPVELKNVIGDFLYRSYIESLAFSFNINI